MTHPPTLDWNTDYETTAPTGARACLWITVGNVSVRIQRTATTVGVELYAKGCEDYSPVDIASLDCADADHIIDNVASIEDAK